MGIQFAAAISAATSEQGQPLPAASPVLHRDITTPHRLWAEVPWPHEYSDLVAVTLPGDFRTEPDLVRDYRIEWDGEVAPADATSLQAAVPLGQGEAFRAALDDLDPVTVRARLVLVGGGGSVPPVEVAAIEAQLRRPPRPLLVRPLTTSLPPAFQFQHLLVTPLDSAMPLYFRLERSCYFFDLSLAPEGTSIPMLLLWSSPHRRMS